MNSSYWLRNGSFLRLKNIEIGYQIPKKFLSKIGFEAARIYLMGYNLAVWDHIKYFDPEAGNANAGLNYRCREPIQSVLISHSKNHKR